MAQAKKGGSILLSVILVLSLLSCFAAASTKASDYLSEYGVALFPGETKGQYDIFFDLTATDTSDLLGLSKVVVYKSDGTYVTTIKGTVKNGLIAENDYCHTGVYTCSAISGNSYYAIVTVFAKRGSGSDSREITTNTVKVP